MEKDEWPEGKRASALLLGEDYYWVISSGLYDLFTKEGKRELGLYMDGTSVFFKSVFAPLMPYPPELVGKELVGDERVDAINSEATRLWAETVYLTGAWK